MNATAGRNEAFHPHRQPAIMMFRHLVVLTLVSWVLSSPAQANMVHRWSFNNPSGPAANGLTIPPVVGSAQATVVGVGATFDGSSLILPGTTTGNQSPATISAYIDLPNGIISSKTHLTVEIWAKPITYQQFQRLLDFGRITQAGDGFGAAGEITPLGTTAPGTTSSRAGLTLTFNRNTANNLSQQRFETRINGVGAGDTTGQYGISDTAITTTAGTEYHYVLTFTPGIGAFSATGGRASWYRNGTWIASLDTSFRLNQIEDVNNWLGRSHWSADRATHAAYNEVRIHDHAMSPAEILSSFSAGPNATFTPPLVANDSVAIHRNQKVRIAVLANDTGTLAPGTVTIVQQPQSGTATPDPSGKILYAHTTGTPATDSFTYTVGGAGGTSSPATVTINFSGQLRIPNSSFNVPASPPPVSIQAINAFPGLTFTLPTCMASPPGDGKRLFVCTKGGSLHLVRDVTAATPTASNLLTLNATTGGLFNGRSPAEALNTGSECGLLGLAFHPNFATNGYIYLFYSVNINSVLHQRVSRLTLNNPTTATPTVNLASELTLIEQADQEGNHNGGDLHFGPDGYLYISLGDEGGQNDQRFNAQRIDKDFFSGILRIDVDKKPGNLAPNANPNPLEYPTTPPADAVKRDGGIARYSIPADNPFVGATTFNGAAVNAGFVRSEFWAVGLRNPWRMSFDTNGELWVGDVGGGQREEINVITRGGNYGWVYLEGLLTGPWAASTPSHTAPPAGFTSLPPLYNYARGTGTFQGTSVTGGIVYRGTRVPGLTGAYLFADYVSGNVWSLVRNGTSSPIVTRVLGEGGIVAFGKDPSNGDVLMADHNDNIIRRIATVTDTAVYPPDLTSTGLFADLADLSPAPGLLPYQVNLPFWSDHAIKRRWFAIPDAVSKMNWSRDGEWSFPSGQIWVKHFDIETTRGNPATRKRLETRLLVKNPAGAYGVSYRWNEAGTEAVLVDDPGVDLDLDLTVNGAPYTQRWRIPSRAECMTCHTPQAGFALSSNTRQLNLTGTLNGFTGNQLMLLHQGGYFYNTPESPNLLPRHLRPDEVAYPVEARVRSYLAVNCAYCHKSGGTAAPSAWDGRHELTLAETGLVNGTANNNGGNPLNKLVVPGDPARSVVLNRVAMANGFTRMPPLGSNEMDQADIALLTEWINTSLPARQTYDDWRLSNFLSATSPEGAPGEDADGDGFSNWNEFLAATGPRSGASFLSPHLACGPSEVSLSFTVPPNRSILIEHSENLGGWQPWDVPGNQGLPSPGGSFQLSGPRQGDAGFFRVRLREN